MKPILYLLCRSGINHIRQVLRSPKKLIPLLIFALIFLQSLAFRSGRYQDFQNPSINPVESVIGAYGDWIWVGLFSVLLLFMIYRLTASFYANPLVFSLAQIDVLLPTPIPRKLIIGYKLMYTYVKPILWLLYLGFFLMVLNNPATAVFRVIDGASIFVILGTIFFLAASINNTNVIINLAAAYRPGGKWWLASAIRGFIAALLALVLLTGVWRYFTTSDLPGSIVYMFTSTATRTIFFPAVWATDLILSPVLGWKPHFVFEFLMLGLIAVLTFYLAINRKENPYEPTLTASAKAAAMKLAMKKGSWNEAMKQHFAKRTNHPGIRPFGRGAVAMIWKNVNIDYRESAAYLPHILIVVAGLFITGKIVFREIPGLLVGDITAGIILYLLFFGAMAVSSRHRLNLKQADMLKPIPIPGWQMMAAEAIRGVINISVFVWVITIFEVILFGVPANSYLVLLSMAIPFLSYALSCSLLGIAVIFPKWDEPLQQQISMILSMFVMGLTLLPPVGIAILLRSLGVWSMAGVILAIIYSTGISVAGIAFGTWAYNRYDPTNE